MYDCIVMGVKAWGGGGGSSPHTRLDLQALIHFGIERMPGKYEIGQPNLRKMRAACQLTYEIAVNFANLESPRSFD